MSDLGGNPEDRFSSVAAKLLSYYTSMCVRKPTIRVSTRSDTNRPVQSQKLARSLKFQIYEEKRLYNPCRENK